MPRPLSKDELLQAATMQYAKLCALIEGMTLEEQESLFDFAGDNKKEAHWVRDTCLRDVLVHLYEWHNLLVEWINSNRNGVERPFLPSPYNWKTYGALNDEFCLCHRDTALGQAKRLLESSHAEVMGLIDSFTNSELFEKGQFSWTGTTTLGSYCVSATSSHYDWAIKKIRAHLRKIRTR
ncbi:MAG: ClbS/DfsB family four-helix bundle protein [Actinomycetaceae bacterium]|nr:ClbS/DfsB family four-helix bundle protein [Actinomycetaceae bacterium]